MPSIPPPEPPDQTDLEPFVGLWGCPICFVGIQVVLYGRRVDGMLEFVDAADDPHKGVWDHIRVVHPEGV